MLNLIHDQLKTKKKLPTCSYKYCLSQMRDKAIIVNGATLESVSDSFENWQMCDKAVGNYLHALKFLSQKMFFKALIHSMYFNLFLAGIKVFFEDHFW